jgi:hypothetical protein
MPGSDALKGDIAAIMQRNQQQHEEKEQKKEKSTAPPSSSSVADDRKSAKHKSGWNKKKQAQDEEPPAEDEADGPGTYQKAHGAKPKTGEANLHNMAIAEAAAKKYKKNQKNIQRAVRKLDPPDNTPKQGCGASCVIS